MKHRQSLIKVNTDLLVEYKENEVANKSNWDIFSYLNLRYDINAALAFSKLYFPDFVEIKNCLILNCRYDERIFKDWYASFDGDIKKTEMMCNYYSVSDYFHINQVAYESDKVYNEVIRELANALKISWEVNCQLLFPERNIEVEIFEEDNITRITLYTKSL